SSEFRRSLGGPEEGEVRWRCASGDAHAHHMVAVGQRVHHVEAARDLAEHGVHAVEVLRVGFAEDHKELRTAGILAGVRHREGADLVRLRITRRLALDLVARATGAWRALGRPADLRVRATALDDALGD